MPVPKPRHNPKQDQHKRDKRLFLLAFFMELAVLCLTVFIIYIFNRYEILPLKHRILLTAILIVSNVYFAIILKVGIKKRSIRKVGLVLAALTLVFTIAFSAYLNQAVAALNKVSEIASRPVEIKKVVMSVRVLKNSPITNLKDLADKQLAAAYSSDKNNIDKFYTEFDKANKISFAIRNVPSYLSAVEELFDSMVPAVLLNEDHLSIIKNKFPQFEEQTRVISTGSLESETAVQINKVDTASEPFTILISGIDTFGDIETSSRSDVNIIVTVNPKTKTILMTNIPRDMYMKIPGDGKNEFDKLTHAGIYGVQTSVQAVENFMDIRINYFLKVNFTSVVTLVDLIGGVQVENPYAFVSASEVDFPAGLLHLDGNKALTYCRERYNLLDGDNDRGKNQERVLSAIIQKMIGTETIKNFSSILATVQRSMQTSMTTNDIMKLVNLQIGSGTAWKIMANSIVGDGQYGWPSYAAPGYNVFVQIPDKDSVLAAKKKINAVVLDLPASSSATDGVVQTTESDRTAVQAASSVAGSTASSAAQ